jgi:hypothetical protein
MGMVDPDFLHPSDLTIPIGQAFQVLPESPAERRPLQEPKVFNPLLCDDTVAVDTLSPGALLWGNPAVNRALKEEFGPVL